MSDTYKTDPSWVKLRTKRSARKEIHDHRDGVCNFDTWETFKGGWWPRKCGYTVRYYGYSDGFFNISSRWLKAEIAESHGSARAKLRKDRHEMLKLDIEDIMDYDVVNPNHRHSAIWHY
jgi:hypothetical protein